MKEDKDCDLFLYADDSCLVYQHKYVKEIERNLNKNFSNVCDWFVDNKLSIHFEEDKKNVYYLAQNIDMIKSVVLILSMVRYILSNITQ